MLNFAFLCQLNQRQDFFPPNFSWRDSQKLTFYLVCPKVGSSFFTHLYPLQWLLCKTSLFWKNRITKMDIMNRAKSYKSSHSLPFLPVLAMFLFSSSLLRVKCNATAKEGSGESWVAMCKGVGWIKGNPFSYLYICVSLFFFHVDQLDM